MEEEKDLMDIIENRINHYMLNNDVKELFQETNDTQIEQIEAKISKLLNASELIYLKKFAKKGEDIKAKNLFGIISKTVNSVDADFFKKNKNEDENLHFLAYKLLNYTLYAEPSFLKPNLIERLEKLTKKIVYDKMAYKLDTIESLAKEVKNNRARLLAFDVQNMVVQVLQKNLLETIEKLKLSEEKRKQQNIKFSSLNKNVNKLRHSCHKLLEFFKEYEDNDSELKKILREIGINAVYKDGKLVEFAKRTQNEVSVRINTQVAKRKNSGKHNQNKKSKSS